MNILEELKEYCSEKKPAGALMLTGEWGCGKTYYLENVLKKELEDTHIILRVSLFGMKSVESIRNEVKKSWLFAFANKKKETKRNKKIKRYIRGLKPAIVKSFNLLPKTLKTIADSVMSINILDFIEVKSKIDDKDIVLVFDDLERANIPISELLGCINDYCENSYINTIIVTNEEKIIERTNKDIKYSEIKEKIVQRTIVYKPDYRIVVDSVIEEINLTSKTYKEMLYKHKDEVADFFSEEPWCEESLNDLKCENSAIERNENVKKEKKRPHNIRSLKCALQDFNRIYEQLEKHKIEEIDRWLFSFLSYFVCIRAGIGPKTDKYGDRLANQDIFSLYSGYYDSEYITKSIERWIITGAWKEEDFENELAYKVAQKRAVSPMDKARLNRLMDLEECDISEGYFELLKEAYAGNISLYDYVLLLWNYSWGRNYHIDMPEINWSKMNAGVDSKINKMLENKEEQPHERRTIPQEKRHFFTEEELCVYDKIAKFLDRDTLVYEKNRQLYLENIEENPMKAFRNIKDYRFDRFDNEMAEITVKGFEKCSNREKNDFCIYFYNLWHVVLHSMEYKTELSYTGMHSLKKRLVEYRSACHEKNMQIAEAHTHLFIEKVEALLSEH